MLKKTVGYRGSGVVLVLYTGIASKTPVAYNWNVKPAALDAEEML